MRRRSSENVRSMREMEGELERLSSKSSHIFSTSILPPLGAPSNRKHKLRPFTVSPFDSRYRAWETFLVILVFYTAWVSPFEFGFLRGPKGPLTITDNIVNGFFAIDIVLTFFVAYLNKSTYLLVDDRKLIALRYAKTGLVLDVISTIPSELARNLLPAHLEAYGYFSMLRLWRIRRVSAMFQRMEKDKNYNYVVVRIAKLTCHLAASKGFLECVLLLLDYGANPNKKDSEGNVPLWDAILEKHEAVIKVLVDNGATLSSGDVGGFACFAVEQNNIELLKEITKFGGDVTLLNSSGTTALHTAISEENVEIVKFLMEQGADIDKPDVHGWTPRALADHQGHEEIKALFETKQKSKDHVRHQENEQAPYFNLKKYSSESAIPPAKKSLTFTDSSVSKDRLKRKPSNFQNSLAEIITAGNKQISEGGKAMSRFSGTPATGKNCVRVTLSCPERGDRVGRLVFLPGSLEELLNLGYQKFSIRPTKILTEGGFVIEDWLYKRW
ncbi:UNVERIFIED_CONTAM: Potassium channel AKT1 [Sesamum latifolium]|uniref:Potassium channel AKT1 n=1 Tax=Sesamum latifolium TaxID=2727402 RepID=A0AAW2SNI4_9LAMI